ncbi:MAG: SGNH/GDSL hydrolase family protein [Planctomycetota bacterium]
MALVSILKSKRGWTIAAALLVVLLAVGEGVARWGLGLGDPPLMEVDERYEYRRQPGVYHRFGKEIRVNEYAMRSDPVTPTKTDPRELRVLCLGDSVINGGTVTDHADLATTMLQQQLAERLDRPVWVGNVSEGSWGPGNLLAYTRAHGWFDADVVVILLSSHDAGDVMNFKPMVGVNLDMPDTRPWFALQEGVQRYFWPRFVAWWSPPEGPPRHVVARGSDLEFDQPRVQQGLKEFGELLDAAAADGRPVVWLAHAEALVEYPGDWLPAHGWMREVADASAAEVLDLREAMRSAARQGVEPYRDQIHLNEAGQEVLAEVMLEWVTEAITAE